MKKLRLAAVLFAVSSFLASGNTFADDQSQQTSKVPERLDITFDHQRGGIASSQYAIWVEDELRSSLRNFESQNEYGYKPCIKRRFQNAETLQSRNQKNSS